MNNTQSIAASLQAANKTNQMIIVVGNGGSRATISFHEKQENQWTELFTTDGFVGLNGITKDKKEGDAKTPAGVFPLGLAFGIEPNPETKLSYREVTDTHYWVDDVTSEYYNLWVDTKETANSWNSAEHLIDETIAYKYGVEICFNTSNIPGKGSAVFLHCIHGNSTAGCVSVPEDVMRNILKKVDQNTVIVIAETAEGLHEL